jgi:dynein heavy chain
MSIILFDDALRHIIRIARVLGMPRGNLLLVGVGGSGKESLARLAACIVQHNLFTMVVSKAYTVNSLLDDLRALYKACGQQGQKTTFLVKDNNLKNETFLDVFNAVLTTGEVPNLLPKDELQFMAADLRTEFLQVRPRQRDTPENLVRFFIDRVRANLHLVLCVSPGDGQLAERAQRYPGLLSGCTVDWCLPWPEDALVAVSSGLLNREAVDCSEDVRKQLVTHMGVAHRIVVDCCAEYFNKLRRSAYQTPKSFLTCLKEFEALYAQKSTEVQVKASRVSTGLEKLAKGADDVRRMKIALMDEEQKLRLAEEAANAMLSKLEVSSMEAKTEADAVANIAAACEADRARVLQEKADAEEDLAKAQPFVEEAERAVNSIKPNDLNELKKMAKPADILKLIFDCVALLKMEKLVPVQPAEITMGVGKDKRTVQFIKDSYKIAYATMLTDARFLQNIFHFSKYDKDFINDETVELMMPYLELEGFNPAVARNASKAAEGLCTWCRAMVDYHNASKVVKPKLEALRLAEARLADAERELYKAETKLQACQDVLAKLQADFDAQIASKRRIEKNAACTRERMEKATALIEGLASERARWTSDQNKFADYKRRLVGDCALAAAFIAYCGPFNQDFREYVIHSRLASDLKERHIPLTVGLSMVQFLVDPGTIGEWNLHGLPTDMLSIQNGILVTRAKRYPLLIDPQGQALPWIQRLHAHCTPTFGATNFSNSRFREQLEHALAEGLALVVTGVNTDVDPIVIPVLEQATVTKGSNTYMMIQGKLCDFNPNFRCYLTTRMPNPHFSPELQARTTVVDFTVTQFGLEEQLLGHVIQREQRPLEEQLKVLLEEVTTNTKALLRLDEQLLERLAENTGNLLDDDELVDVLAVTKAKAIAVNEKLSAAGEMRKGINEKRESYRPVATRGSVLYFSIVDMAGVNKMYQVSLDQFRSIFDRSIEQADKAATPAKRVYNIIDTLTYNVYRYMNRGLYESDKVVFKLLILLKAMMAAGKLQQRHITLLTRVRELAIRTAALFTPLRLNGWTSKRG